MLVWGGYTAGDDVLDKVVETRSRRRERLWLGRYLPGLLLAGGLAWGWACGGEGEGMREFFRRSLIARNLLLQGTGLLLVLLAVGSCHYHRRVLTW